MNSNPHIAQGKISNSSESSHLKMNHLNSEEEDGPFGTTIPFEAKESKNGDRYINGQRNNHLRMI